MPVFVTSRFRQVNQIDRFHLLATELKKAVLIWHKKRNNKNDLALFNGRLLFIGFHVAIHAKPCIDLDDTRASIGSL